jgi:hypothetical protein
MLTLRASEATLDMSSAPNEDINHRAHTVNANDHADSTEFSVLMHEQSPPTSAIGIRVTERPSEVATAENYALAANGLIHNTNGGTQLSCNTAHNSGALPATAVITAQPVPAVLQASCQSPLVTTGDAFCQSCVLDHYHCLADPRVEERRGVGGTCNMRSNRNEPHPLRMTQTIQQLDRHDVPTYPLPAYMQNLEHQDYNYGDPMFTWSESGREPPTGTIGGWSARRLLVRRRLARVATFAGLYTVKCYLYLAGLILMVSLFVMIIYEVATHTKPSHEDRT